MKVIKHVALIVLVVVVVAIVGLMVFSAPVAGVGIKAFEVKAPVEKAFAFMADQRNYYEDCRKPGKTFTDFQGQGLGQTWHASYPEIVMKSSTVEQDYVWSEFEPNRRLVSFQGNTFYNDGEKTFVFSPTPDGGTRIVWIEEGYTYLPAGLALTSWGRRWGQQPYRKYQEEFAKCVKDRIEELPADSANSNMADQDLEKISMTLSSSVFIASPQEKVFKYMTDPDKYPEWWLSAKINNVNGWGVGRTEEYVTEIEGTKFTGSAVCVDFVPNQRYVWRILGDVSGMETFILLPEGDGTRVTAVMDYYLEVPANDSALLRALTRDNIRSGLDMSFQKAKAAIEGQ